MSITHHRQNPLECIQLGVLYMVLSAVIFAAFKLICFELTDTRIMNKI
jgi:hypothetical protein